jgi:hypothetical protein
MAKLVFLCRSAFAHFDGVSLDHQRSQCVPSLGEESPVKLLLPLRSLSEDLGWVGVNPHRDVYLSKISRITS